MFAQTAVIAALAFGLSVSALQITQPSNTTGWVATGAQVITWDFVNTDPSNFTIQLITPSDPNNPVTIAENVQSADKTYTYTPSSDLQAADQYRVNFVSDRSGILAQSNYFEVEAGTSTVSASSSASASGSSTGSAGASTTSAAQTSGTSQNPSSASSAAPSSSSTGAASQLVAPGGLLLLVTGALSVLA